MAPLEEGSEWHDLSHYSRTPERYANMNHTLIFLLGLVAIPILAALLAKFGEKDIG